MEVILNIGLDGIPFTGESFTNGQRNPDAIERACTALQAARHRGLGVKEAKLLVSDTEPTLVVRAEIQGYVHDAVYALAKQLNQDCIAGYLPDQDSGFLSGPRADKWGAFNPVFFFQLDGTRLGRGDLAQAA